MAAVLYIGDGIDSGTAGKLHLLDGAEAVTHLIAYHHLSLVVQVEEAV